MSSVTKALKLLSHFSPTHPEIGLSQLCRMAKRDKATTYRHLQALEGAGFVEQNPQTKHYRLGPTVMHLAEVREMTVPRQASARAPLETLANATGETAHVTVLSGTTLYALDDCEAPQHGIRAVVDINAFPLHATASGTCALAFGPETLMRVAEERLESFTAETPTTIEALRELVSTIKATGFGQGTQSYEAEIIGVAAPVFDQTGTLAGCVSVASVAARFTPELERIVRQELTTAARDITRNWGGTLPPAIEAAWAKTLTHQSTMEPTP